MKYTNTAAVKRLTQEMGFRTSGDFLDELNDKVQATISDACERAEKNQRSTVMGRDL